MIGQVMMYLVMVSVVVSAAVWIADEGLRRAGVQTRWLWLLALAAGPLLLLVGAVLPPASASAISGAVPGDFVFELPEVVVGGDDAAFPWMTFLMAGWLASSVLMLAIVARAHMRLRAERLGWSSEEVDGMAVYVSRDRGPAVAGVLRPWIVLPRWALDLPTSQRELVLLHEDEHARGGDTRLLPLSLLLLALTPWNPISWWQFGRLRTAMEVDCDRRVLRRQPERAAYGESLLTVAARSSGAGLALAAFSERPHTLRRRIVSMTETRTPWSSFRAAIATLFAIVIGVQACGVDSPVVLDESGIQTAEVSEVVVPEPDVGEPSERLVTGEPVDSPPPPPPAGDLEAGPTFTPFTVAPSITNREEIIRTMNESYPPLLREAGIGGTVRVYFFISADGIVEQVRLDQSAGHPALDEAAMNVAGAYRFSPARNGDDPVPVWVSFPITFQVR
jgi:TonB family protein